YTVDVVEKCPYGWTNFGVRCYKFFSQSANWITAERNCQSFDANLASVHNKIEQDLLLSLLPSSTRCWIGAHDGEQEGQWVWSDGTPYDFTYWGSGEPNNLGTENCGELNWSCKNAVFCFVLKYIFMSYNNTMAHLQKCLKLNILFYFISTTL
uniref:C-type lectin domain-containing protein n=1 Tax=Sinocyclocheilus grahami TaxID=75366 RepID=A0A672SUD7_SINGR